MGAKLEDLPCFKTNCHYCKKAHENWARFTEEVDEAVPLGVGMHCSRIAGGGGSTKIYWDKEDNTKVETNGCSSEDVSLVEINRCLSEDVSLVVLKGVPEGSKCGSESSKVSSTSDQERPFLIRDSPVQISDGGGFSGSGESGPVNLNIGVAARDSGWYKINKINPSGDPELQEVAKDVLLEEAMEAHIEPVMAGEYEMLGIDANDTSGPSCWGLSIEDQVVAQDKDPDLETLVKWRRRRMLMWRRFSQWKRRRRRMLMRRRYSQWNKRRRRMLMGRRYSQWKRRRKGMEHCMI
ncbi:hypothetical protein DPMN_113526 [Dreissena polymorpha]|uniref:Uncharacterized protein n=1 Tax=Dreissena polymorpha TaxID=45954 RepID=A0A9D4KIG4_DREPO|nr:hypothetical protein DPMN_113526 [Dreissena polymorpha]